MKASDIIKVGGSTAPLGVEDNSIDVYTDVVRGFVDSEVVGKAFVANKYGVDVHVRMLMDIVERNSCSDDPACQKILMQALKQLNALQKDVVKSKEMMAKLSMMDRAIKTVEAKDVKIPTKVGESSVRRVKSGEQDRRDRSGGDTQTFGSVHFEPEIPKGAENQHGGIGPQKAE